MRIRKWAAFFVVMVLLTVGLIPPDSSDIGSPGFVAGDDVQTIPNSLNIDDPKWLDQFGTFSYDWPWGICMDNNFVYVSGTTGSSIDGINHFGGADAFVRKYDLDGNVLWTSQFGTAAMDRAIDIDVCTAGIVVVGDTRGAFPGFVNKGSMDWFVALLSPNNGNIIWIRQHGTVEGDEANSVQVGQNGIYINVNSKLNRYGHPGIGGTDVYVYLMSMNGFLGPSVTLGTINLDRSYDMVLLGTSLFVCGMTYGALQGFVNKGSQDAFIYHLSLNLGIINWVQFGTPKYDVVESICAQDLNSIYIGGHTDGTFPGFSNNGMYDVFVQRYDAGLNLLWTDQFGGAGYDGAYDICTDHRGVYVGGETTDANWDSWDGFVRGYDTAGAPLWTYEIGSDDGWEWISGVEISNRGFFFCGETSGSMPGCVNLGDSDCFAGMMLSDADISASPISYDYGDVTVWDSPMTLITVVNNGMEALVIDELYFEQGDTDYFTFPYYYDLPVYVMGGQVRYVAVSYHPWEEGSHSTYLCISSNDIDTPIVKVALSGTAVASEDPPEDQVDDTTDYIDDAIEDGDLVGDGDGNSADNKLDAFLDMFEEVKALYDAGNIEDAIGTLKALLKKCDGDPKPPDTVTGEAAEELAARIQWLIEEMEKEL